MEFFKYIFENYKDNMLGMAFAYIGIISIVMMFLPKDNFINKLDRVTSDINNIITLINQIKPIIRIILNETFTFFK